MTAKGRPTVREGRVRLWAGKTVTGGSCEIRTHEGRKPLPVFKTGAFNRSAKLPEEVRMIPEIMLQLKKRHKNTCIPIATFIALG